MKRSYDEQHYPGEPIDERLRAEEFVRTRLDHAVTSELIRRMLNPKEFQQGDDT